MSEEKNPIEESEGFICSDCGKDISDDDKTCPHCGADLTIIEEPEEQNKPINTDTTQNTNRKVSLTTHSPTRHYKTAYTLAKVIEFISWFILIGGIISGIALASDFGDPTLGIIIVLVSLVFGLLLVFLSQLTLIFIDTENNTRKSSYELEKMSCILSEMSKSFESRINNNREPE